jgi:hypothetical protein
MNDQPFDTRSTGVTFDVLEPSARTHELGVRVLILKMGAGPLTSSALQILATSRGTNVGYHNPRGQS